MEQKLGPKYYRKQLKNEKILFKILNYENFKVLFLFSLLGKFALVKYYNFVGPA